MEKIFIKHQKNVSGTIALPSSKSESNRALIINALAGSHGNVQNLSSARDTRTMVKLLSTDQQIADVIDAGTTMRFLTAYFSVMGKYKIMTGVPRMKQRPIRILVDALREIGARIDYLEAEGYPPVELHGIKEQARDSITMKGDISSQYISAMMMIAPLLPQGLKIQLSGKISSRPYIEMTRKLMLIFGADITWKDEKTIVIKARPYQTASYKVESDWSGASYWYSMAALAGEASIFLKDVKSESFQGDSEVKDIFEWIGITTSFTSSGAQLAKKSSESCDTLDFYDCPDLAQTVLVTLAGLKRNIKITGLESLKIKETDRVSALQNELAKLNVQLVEHDPHNWELLSTGFRMPEAAITIDTYDDHRMAMAFAPLALLGDVIIENPSVVQKSYPEFWDHLKGVGFVINQV